MAKVTREKFKVYEGVFDNKTLETIDFLRAKNYIDILLNPIKTGKEGDVYLASKEEDFRALKIYRVSSANFKKIQQYINRDFRFRNIKGNLRKVILVWVSKEFRNLKICHSVNMNVPFPYKCLNNVIVMDFINGPMLKDCVLENPKLFFKQLLEQIKLMRYEAKLVHGDLSEYNILVKDNMPYIIDMGQAMSIKNDDDFKLFYDLYERDIKIVVKYFKRVYKLDISEEEVFKELENYSN